MAAASASINFFSATVSFGKILHLCRLKASHRRSVMRAVLQCCGKTDSKIRKYGKEGLGSYGRNSTELQIKRTLSGSL